MNFRVILVADDNQTVDICRSGEKTDIILTDIKKPLMDGYPSTAEIKKFMPELKIIAQTAFADMEDRHKVIMAGFADFLA